tara:strand:- start:1850 stop:2542 length:693 start_codon:yes stop_codon:yes gene_type:complete
MNFDGVNEAIQTPQDVLDITTSISISGWFKTTDTSSIVQIVCKDRTSGNNRSWAVSWRGSSFRYLLFSFWNTSGVANNTTSTANILDDGLWHHFVCTYDGTNSANGIKLYLDGVLDKQGTASSTGIRNYTGTNSNIAIGAISTTGARFFNGDIEEVAIWDGVVLDSTDVTNVYNSGTPNDLTSLAPQVWCRMGDLGTWGGTNWTFPNQGSLTFDFTSVLMEEVDRIADIP